MRDDRPDHAAAPEDSNEDNHRWMEDPNSRPSWPAQYAREAGGQWTAAHRRLIAKLRAEGTQYINKKLDNLRNQLGVPHNGWTFERTQGSAQVVMDAQDELKRLQLRARANRADRHRLHHSPSPATPVSEGPRKPTTQEWVEAVCHSGRLYRDRGRRERLSAGGGTDHRPRWCLHHRHRGLLPERRGPWCRHRTAVVRAPPAYGPERLVLRQLGRVGSRRSPS